MPTRFIYSKIELDALFGDVAVHPVPPHARLGGIGRRRLEAFLQRETRPLTEGPGCHADNERQKRKLPNDSKRVFHGVSCSSMVSFNLDHGRDSRRCMAAS